MVKPGVWRNMRAERFHIRTVTFIEDGSLLGSIGGVGAFLRWRE
jgi:hypothetical protein